MMDSFKTFISESRSGWGDPYHGRNVTWFGEKGRVVRVGFHNSYPIWGNTFEQEKYESMVEAINNSEENYEFEMPLASPTRIGHRDVEEYLQDPDEHYSYDPLGPGPELTFGDADIDEFVRDPDQWVKDELFVDLDDLNAFMGGNADFIDFDDEDEVELFTEAAEQYRGMIEAKKSAIENQEGSIGKIHFQIRDGNHRRVAAAKAGEPYFFAHVVSNDLQDAEEWLKDILI